MAVGRVENRITITGKDAASAKVDKVAASMGRLEGAAVRVKGGLGQAAFAFNQFAGAAGAIGAVVSSLAAFARAGEVALNATRAAKGALDSYSQSMAAAQEATAGLVEGTDLEIFLTKTAKLGLSAKLQTEALAGATKAALALGKGVDETIGKLEQVARGRTTALADLGILLDRDTAVLEYRRKHGLLLETLTDEQESIGIMEIAVDRLNESFGDVRPDQYATTIQKALTTVGDVVSDASAQFAHLFEGMDGVKMRANEINQALKEQARAAYEDVVALKAYNAAVEAGGGVLGMLWGEVAKLTTEQEAAAVATAAQTAIIADQIARAQDISGEYARWQQESRGLTDQQMNVEAWTKRVANAERDLAKLTANKTDTQLAAIKATGDYANTVEGLALAQRNLMAATAAANAELGGQAAIATAATAHVIQTLRALGIDVGGKGAGGSGGSGGSAKPIDLKDLIAAAMGDAKAKRKVSGRDSGIEGILKAALDSSSNVAPKQMHYSRDEMEALAWGESAAGSDEDNFAFLSGAGDGMAKAAKVNELAAAYRDFTAAFSEMGGVMQSISPDMATAMDAITVATEGLVAAQGNQAGQVSAVLAGSSKLAAGLIKDTQAQAAVQAAIETARGFASFANPPVAAAHFLAATMFGIAAATGGGQRSAGAAGKANLSKPIRPKASKDSGPGTTVQNLYILGATKQQVGEAFNRMQRATDGTGMSGGAI